jgi:hypothetical protein
MKSNKKYFKNFLLKHSLVLSVRYVFLISAISLFNFSLSFASLSGDFRSAASGNWNDPSHWEVYKDSLWVTASDFPTYRDGEITIRPGNYMNVNENVCIDQLRICVGGQLQINESKVLCVKNGFGTDLYVEGALFINGTLSGINSSEVVISGIVLVKPNGRNIFESGSRLSIVENGLIHYMDKWDEDISFSSIIFRQSNAVLTTDNLIADISDDLLVMNAAGNSISFSSMEELNNNDKKDSLSDNSFSNCIDFSVILLDSAIELNWNVDAKCERDHGAIERSSDGVHFFEINAPIEMDFQSDLKVYRSFDRNPVSGNNFYRIKFPKNENENYYSDVAVLNFKPYSENGDELKIVSLLENPFTRNFELDFVVPDEGEVDLALLNSSGKRICYDKIYVSNGLNSYEFFKKFGRKNGISFITISRDDQMVLEKIQKY